MREIKFRAWCKNKNEWESDNWCLYPNGCIVEVKSNRPMMARNHILEQFTGLKDKNGVEIYEGDKYRWAVTGNIAEYGEIVFKNGCIWCDRYQDGESFELFSMVSSIEIIGNIHENPELLEATK